MDACGWQPRGLQNRGAPPLGDWFVRNIDKIDIEDPETTARRMPVFEIFPASPDDETVRP